MKCADVQRYFLENAPAEMPPAMREHLLGCAECRLAYRRALTVVQLLALKRHEQPEAGFEVRNLARVRDALAAGAPEPEGWWQRLWAGLGSGPVPGFRLAMAAAVVLLVGINFYWNQTSPLSPDLPSSVPALAPRAPTQVAAATNLAPTLALNPDLPVMFLPSNRQPAILQPGGIQYGPGGSRMVNFEEPAQ